MKKLFFFAGLFLIMQSCAPMKKFGVNDFPWENIALMEVIRKDDFRGHDTTRCRVTFRQELESEQGVTGTVELLDSARFGGVTPPPHFRILVRLQDRISPTGDHILEMWFPPSDLFPGREKDKIYLLVPLQKAVEGRWNCLEGRFLQTGLTHVRVRFFLSATLAGQRASPSP